MQTIEQLGIENLKVYQKDGAYKFTSDAILLANFAKGKAGDVVADFCSGSGIVGFYFYGLNKKTSSITFFEMQKELFDLSVESIKLNNLTNFTAVNVSVQDIAKEYNGKFSLILCNPPFEKASAGFIKNSENIALCTSEITLTLKELIASVAKRLKFGGRFCMVHRADRLAEIIFELKNCGIEPKRLQFVQANANKESYLVLIEGVRGGKSGIKIMQNIIKA